MRMLFLLGVITWHVASTSAMSYTHNDDAEAAITASINTFSNKFFKAIVEQKPGKNVICSPISASMVLSMVAFGARGNTETQLRTALALNSDDGLTKIGMQELIESFDDYKQVELRLANKIFLAESFTPKTEFMSITKTAFHSQAQSLNFNKNVEASEIINDWAEAKTNHRIKDLIKPDDLSSDTALVLVNAVYFKGNWKSQFNASHTKPRPFHIDATTVKEVPTMYKSDSFYHGELPEVKATFVELPYKMGSFRDVVSMYVILPNEITGLAELEKNLDKVTVQSIGFARRRRDVDIYLPKFKIESTIDLEEPLHKLGLTDMFDPSLANFTGIDGAAPLVVSKIVQKAFIEVNEEGSEAAAATLFLLGVVTWHVASSSAASVAHNDEAKVAIRASINTFSDKLFKAIVEQTPGKNVICSPISASMVLSMVAFGARGNTETQLRTALALSSDDDLTKIGMQRLIESFDNYKQVELRLANKIFLNEGFTPKTEFMSITKTAFHSQAQSLNFGNNVDASKAINDWAEANTNNRIKNLITPDDLSSDTALVLVNAVYFKGSWASKFDASYTEPSPFHVDATTVKEVPTMYKYGSFYCGELSEVNVKFVELPYKSEGSKDAVSMFIILPGKITGLAKLEKNLDKVIAESIASSRWRPDVKIRLPKFKIESTIYLEEPLSKLGLTDMFDPFRANFTGIADTPPLVVSKVLQKAFIEVNEEGSEAAAATQLGAQPLSLAWGFDFIANHPFIYAIVAGDGAANKRTPIFYGCYRGPE